MMPFGRSHSRRCIAPQGYEGYSQHGDQTREPFRPSAPRSSPNVRRLLRDDYPSPFMVTAYKVYQAGKREHIPASPMPMAPRLPKTCEKRRQSSLIGNLIHASRRGPDVHVLINTSFNEKRAYRRKLPGGPRLFPSSLKMDAHSHRRFPVLKTVKPIPSAEKRKTMPRLE